MMYIHLASCHLLYTNNYYPYQTNLSPQNFCARYNVVEYNLHVTIDTSQPPHVTKCSYMHSYILHTLLQTIHVRLHIQLNYNNYFAHLFYDYSYILLEASGLVFSLCIHNVLFLHGKVIHANKIIS